MADMLRYLYYLFSKKSSDSGILYLLKWLRYSAFILLYPIGFGCELRSIYENLDNIAEMEPYLHGNKFLEIISDPKILYWMTALMCIPGIL